MKKYKYKYFIYTNNLNYGHQKIREFETLKEAQNYLFINGGLSGFGNCGWLKKYGCCDIIKQRVYL